MTEMSEMSEMSEVSQAFSSEHGPRGADDISRGTKIGIAIIVVLVLLNVFAYAMRSSAPAKAGYNPKEEEDSESQGPGFVYKSPAKPAPPTKRFIRKKTVRVITTSPTPDDYQEPDSTAAPVPKKLVTSHTDKMFCTVSYRALHETQMPPDGLCDFLAYTEVWVAAAEVRSRYDPESLEAFKKHARAARKTRHGASFSYEYAASIKEAMANSSGPMIKTLWDSKIHDFGILLAYDAMDTLSSGSPNLALLKHLSQEQAKLAGSGSKPHTFLGMINRNFDPSNFGTANMLKQALTSFPITILIVITHFFIYDTSKQPRPPSVWSTSVKMPADMSVIAKNFSSVGFKADVLFLTSYTMAVCKYRMHSNWSGDTSGAVESFSLVRYSDTCYQKSNINSSPKDYVYIANKGKRALLMFDTFETLRYKLGRFYALYTHPKHGVALYDVDYDDNATGCANETFHRVRQVKRYLHS